MANKLPATIDFSKAALDRAVRSKILMNSWLLSATAIGGTLTFAGLLLGFPIFATACGVVCFGGVSGWGVNYFLRYDANAQSYLDEMRSRQRTIIAEYPKRLIRAFGERESDMGLRQLKELEDSFEDFLSLLNKKFSTSGLTRSRFLGTAEQVRLGALEKLQLVIDHMEAIESIPVDLEKQLRGVDPKNPRYGLIKERLAHREQALDNISKLHTDIEQSLTRISEISLQIAKVGNGDSEKEFEIYINELKALAERAPQFQREINQMEKAS